MIDKSMRVVVVTGEDQLRGEIVSGIASAGLDAKGVADSAALFLELLQHSADIVILDIGAEGRNNFNVARQLRSIPGPLGIIVITTSTECSRRIEGLENGADVVLLRPVDPEELNAYIHSLLRRLRADHRPWNPVLWRFHQNEWKLISPSGADIELSHLEAAFVDIIARNAGKAVKRRDIISVAFGKDPLCYDNRRLEAIVSRLRKKVHRSYPLSQPIKVVHSIGYVFTDAIQCV
ncbi:MAG: hypothetical protein JWQ23_771 [Herminiimonas sp.]|nr:hypothetical protein [Herminiimonas sp.]